MRKFEDIMKEKLEGATSEYSGHIWENIKKEIPIAKKSNARFYWMAAFMFAFAMMIFMVQSYPNWKVQQASDNISELESLDVSKFILSPEDLSSRKLYSNTAIKPTLKPLSQEATVLTTESAILAKDVPTLSTAINSSNTIALDFSTINSEVLSGSDFTAETSKSQNVNPIKSEGSLLEDSKIIVENAPLYTLANISNFNIGLKIPDYKIPARKRIKDNDVHCEVLKGKQSRYYITARHVNSYAFNNLETKNPSGDEYMSSRYNSESKKYSFSDEVAFGVEYRGGFFAEIGLRYDQINEKFNYLDPNASGQSTVIVSDTITNTTGETQIIIDTVTTQLSGLREIVNNNHFRKISIPFSVGYQYPLNKKVSIAARTGLVLNVWSKYVGRMFDENLNVVSINDRQSSNDPFFNRLVHSVSASAYLQYKMNKRMEFIVGLDGFKNLGSASYDTNPIDQKYSSLGIFVGTKYNL